MYNYIDKEFNKDFTKHCSLLFQLEEQQFAYAIYEKRSGQLQVLKTLQLNTVNPAEMLEKLKLAIISEDFLQVPFHEIKVNICYSAFTLIPRVIFEDDKARNYLELSAPVESGDTVLVNNINKLFIKNVFSVPNTQVQYLNEIFQSPKIFHIGTTLLENAVRNKDEFNNQQLILDIKPGVIHILYFENKEFKFLNQFRWVNKDDFLYYVLLISDQFNIDREHCDLKLSGEIVPDSMLFSELWKFYKNISFTALNENIVLPKELQEKPFYYFNSLMSLDVCE